MYRWLLLFYLLVTALSVSLQAVAQDVSKIDSDEINVSYIYAAIMGSGTYKIDDRRISMLRIPISLSQRELKKERAGIKWYSPVVIGYDNVTDNDWLGRLLDEDLVTLTVLPGFEYQIPFTDHWTIKPFSHLGVAQDFVREKTILMAVLGLRGLGTWKQPDGWEFRWGNAIRFAAEYQLSSEYHQEFALLETGVDFRRSTKFEMFGSRLSAGAYYIFQYFVPDLDFAETPFRKSDIEMLHELGVSVGLKKPRKLLGLNVTQVRVGYKRGDVFNGWTLGIDFPF